MPKHSHFQYRSAARSNTVRHRCPECNNYAPKKKEYRVCGRKP